MACLNSVQIVGRLSDDVIIQKGSGRRPVIRAKVETFRPVRDREGGTRWISQTHSIVCFRDNLVPVMERHGKKGRFVRVIGELTYDRSGRAEIIEIGRASCREREMRESRQ